MRPFSNLQNDPMPRFLCCETIFIRGMVNFIFRWRFPLEISVAFYTVRGKLDVSFHDCQGSLN